MIHSLAFAIIAVMSLPNGAPVSHFRNHPLGAEGNALRLAGYLDEAARDNRVDVWWLSALAQSESSFDGRRIGKIGEVGIMQSHPRYAAGQAYLRARRKGWSQDQLDWLSIHLGADGLRHGYIVCGTWPRAAHFYKVGKCGLGPAARRVLVLRKRLRRAGGVT